MGSNLARNLASRAGNTVAIFNRSYEKTQTLMDEHPEAEFVPAPDYAAFAASLCEAAHGAHHGAGGQGDRRRDRRARQGLRAGRHHRRRRQRALHRHHPPREGGARDRHQLRRRRHLGRRRGRAQRAVDHARWIRRGVGDARPDPEVHRRDRGGRALRHPRRTRRCRPLRQDDPQRHRVRRHAADRRGLRPDPPRHRQDACRDRRRLRRVEHRRARELPHRDHRRGAAAGRHGDRQAARGCDPRPGGIEGHRRLDGAERARPRHPGVRDRGGRLRPLAVVASPPSAPPHPALPGPASVPPVADADAFIEDVRQALYASKIIAYSQGFDAIVAGAEQYDWDIEKGEIAKIWRGGCIIRARFLNRITEAYAADPGLVALVTAPFFVDVVTPHAGGLAPRGRARRRRRHPDARRSRRRSRTTTASAPTGCPPPSSRGSATSSERTPTGASTRTAPSTRCGRATAARSARPASHYAPTPLASLTSGGGRRDAGA